MRSGSGAIGFLRKPFSDDKLIHCIDTRSRAIRIAKSHQLPPSPANTYRKYVWSRAKRAR